MYLSVIMEQRNVTKDKQLFTSGPYVGTICCDVFLHETSQDKFNQYFSSCYMFICNTYLCRKNDLLI